MSAQRVNRHGIPLLGADPGRCVWPRCGNPKASHLRLHLCDVHARLVHDIVKTDDAQIQAVLEARRADQPSAEPDSPRSEVIYYAQIGGHIKIGWTGRLEQRMRQYPPNTTLLAVHPGTRADERKLHQRFAVHRSHGQEWYPLVPVILDHIKRVVAEHGDPPAITFGARPVTPRAPKPKSQLRAKGWPLLIG